MIVRVLPDAPELLRIGGLRTEYPNDVVGNLQAIVDSKSACLALHPHFGRKLIEGARAGFTQPIAVQFDGVA